MNYNRTLKYQLTLGICLSCGVFLSNDTDVFKLLPYFPSGGGISCVSPGDGYAISVLPVLTFIFSRQDR